MTVRRCVGGDRHVHGTVLDLLVYLGRRIIQRGVVDLGIRRGVWVGCGGAISIQVNTNRKVEGLPRRASRRNYIEMAKQFSFATVVHSTIAMSRTVRMLGESTTRMAHCGKSSCIVRRPGKFPGIPKTALRIMRRPGKSTAITVPAAL